MALDREDLHATVVAACHTHAVLQLFLPAVRAHDQRLELERVMRAPPVAPAFGYPAFGYSTHVLFFPFRIYVAGCRLEPNILIIKTFASTKSLSLTVATSPTRKVIPLSSNRLP